MIDYREISDGAKSRDIAEDVSKELVVLSRVGWTAEKIARHLTRNGYKVGGWTVRYRMLPVARELEKDNEQEIEKLVANFKKARAKTLSAELKATLGFDFLSLDQPKLPAEFLPEKSDVRRPAPPAAKARREEKEESPVARQSGAAPAEEKKAERDGKVWVPPRTRSKDEILADALAKAERREALDEREIEALVKKDNLAPEVAWWMSKTKMSCPTEEEMEWRALFDIPRMTAGRTPGGFDAFEMTILAQCRCSSTTPRFMDLFRKRESNGERRTLDEALAEIGYASFPEFSEAVRRAEKVDELTQAAHR